MRQYDYETGREEIANLPVARVVRKPWWQRLLAWMFPEEIGQYCSRCNARLPSETEDGVCFWCKHMRDLDLGRTSTPEDTEALEKLRDRMVERATMRRVLSTTSHAGVMEYGR